MHRTIEDNNHLNQEIYKKALVIERLQAQKDDLEYGNILKVSELQRLKKDLSRTEENQDGLSNRNTALREKFNQLDSNVRIEGDKISEEMRNFFKKLGLKVVQETAPDNLVELKIQFSENHDYNATFIYDSVTEDYDLISLQPEHPRFRDLRTFLRETKDIQGFLANYRNKIIKNLMENDTNKNNQ